MKLVPVDNDPFGDDNLVPVDGDPFSTQPDGKSYIEKTASNILPSAVEYGKNLLSFAMHPQKGAEAMGQVLSGGVEAAIGSDKDTDSKKKFNEFMGFYKDRYNSIDSLKETFSQDPVGVMADLSTFLTGTGAVTRMGGAAARVPAVSSVGRGIQTAGAALEPTTAAMKTIGEASRLIPEGVSKKLYESSAKFSTVLTENERSALTKTALVNSITPTVNGVVKVGEKIDAINSKISSLIDAAEGTSRGMPINELFKDLGELKKEVLATSGDPIKGVRAIDAIEKQIREANKALRRMELEPAEAQKMKQTLYKELEGQYAELTNSPTNKKAKKLIAKAAKEYLEEIIPEIKQLNADEGALIELRDAIQRSANRVTNRDIMGIGAPIKAAAGGAAGGLPWAIGGYVVGLLDTPAIKSRLAIVVENLRTKGIKIHPASAAVRLGLINVGRANAENGEPIKANDISVSNINDQDLEKLFRK